MEEEDLNGSNMDCNDSETPLILSKHVSNKTSGESLPNKQATLPSDEDSNVCLNSTKKRRNILSDSEDESTTKMNTNTKTNYLMEKAQSSSDDDNNSIFKRNASKSRTKTMNSDDEEREHIKLNMDSNSDSSSEITGEKNGISALDSMPNKTHKNKTNLAESAQSSSESEDYSIFKKNPSKSRLKAMSSSEDEDTEQMKLSKDSYSDSPSEITSVKINGISILVLSPNKPQSKLDNSDKDSSCNDDEVTKHGSDSDSSSKETEQNMRLKNKRNKLSQKFKSLMKSRNGPNKYENDNSAKSSSENSDSDEISSIEKIKQKIKDRSNHLKSTIYDPDTSDDEKAHHIETNKRKIKTKSKKADSPKPVRMSAKQAMENMQKIKSESNRMLREKEVSLPYHRPKALSLKDIMSRRKPALAADGKALPLKMNEEQLRQYALQLELRQKEMIELCKSESEGEDEETNENSNSKEPSTKHSEENNDEPDLNGSNENKVEHHIHTTAPDDSKDISQVNDDLFDTQVSKDSLYETAAEDTLKDNSTLLEGLEVVKNTEDESQLMKLKFDSEPVTYTEKDLAESLNEIQENDVFKDNTEDKVENDSSNTDHINEVNVKEFNGQQRVTNEPQIREEFVNKPSNAKNSEGGDQDYQNNGAVDNPKGIPLNNEIKGTSINDSEMPKKTSIDEENAMNVSESVEGDKFVDSKDDDDGEIDGFSDDDVDMADIDKMIEDADIIVEKATQNDSTIDSPMLIRDFKPTISKPKLTGAPGMVIDLDGNDAIGSKKLSGIELLKERFTYFNKLKTPEEIERQKQNRVKPGIQHLKLKQQLGEQIAEQRSLEWAKRLEEEKQQQAEMKALRGDDDDDDEDEKIETNIDTNDDQIDDNDESEGASEPEENDVILEDKPSKHNPLVDDEAEESDIDEENKANDADDEEGDDEIDESSESSDDELDADKPKKGRILKAFEDSDDEENKTEIESEAKGGNLEVDRNKNDLLAKDKDDKETESQDIELESAQLQKSISEDIFASQESEKDKPIKNDITEGSCNTEDVTKLPVICETQPYDEVKFDEIAGMCSGTFSQNATTLAIESTQLQSQDIGDNVLALCTGNFYDNQFVSQNDNQEKTVDISMEKGDNSTDLIEKGNLSTNSNVEKVETTKVVEEKLKDKKLLQSILLELDDPEFDNPKPNKYFTGGASEKGLEKKRFVIDSDDEESTEVMKKKRRRKLEDRALHISDDEEEEEEELGEEEEELISDLEEDEGAERMVEYDSEENEVELKADPTTKKKKRKATDFFEQEAELTSEDEWVGSGDEDEGGLDRMEREEGDSDTFHQGRLQAELGQIHMRDVMDQDKREVRLLQELLLEDGDLGGGSRQRKFRWRNADGEEETGTNVEQFGDSQEEEFETEEQWRKQRHERDVFLKSMMQKEGDSEEAPSSLSFNRSAIIKANLNKSSNTSVHLEVKPVNEKHDVEKTNKDVPSPVKKPFALLQPKFCGSILSRGSGALARLGALAAPLAADDDKAGSLASTRKGNFVFAALSPAEDKPKMSKRKAEDVGTPNLMKKLKTDEKRKISAKTSLLDHFKT